MKGAVFVSSSDPDRWDLGGRQKGRAIQRLAGGPRAWKLTRPDQCWRNDSAGRVCLMADGGATYAENLGLKMDPAARSTGIRSRPNSMLVDDGAV